MMNTFIILIKISLAFQRERGEGKGAANKQHLYVQMTLMNIIIHIICCNIVVGINRKLQFEN